MDSNDHYYASRKQYYENQMEERLDGVDSFEKNKKAKKRKFKNVDEKINACADPRNTKMVIEFNDRKSTNIKSFAVKKGIK